MNNQENQDWQNDCLDIKSRGEKVLLTGVWADCRFLVGTESHQEEFSAHKLILAMASPVFEKMFYGAMPEKTDLILIPDVTPDAFRGILEYIYADKIKIDSYQKAYEICYAAKKYILPHIVKYCVEYLIQNLNSTNACKTYEFAKLFDENILKTRCLRMISSRTKTILNDSNFMELEISTLLEIFNLDVLNIESELDLLKALNNYAIKNHYITIKQKFPETSEKDNNSNEKQQSDNIVQERNFIDLKAPLEKIRFLTLSSKQFSEIPEKFELLNQSGAFAIFMNISNPMSKYSMPSGFSTSTKPRNYSPPVLSVQREDENFMALNLYNNNRNECEIMDPITGKKRKKEVTLHNPQHLRIPITDFEINFMVDANIIITGIKIRTQQKYQKKPYPETYDECLYVHLLNSDGRLSYNLITEKVDYNSIMDVPFHRISIPINIQENKMYKIGILFYRWGRYPMQTCYPEIRCDNVNFTFSVGSLNEPLEKSLINTILFQRSY